MNQIQEKLMKRLPQSTLIERPELETKEPEERVSRIVFMVIEFL